MNLRTLSFLGCLALLSAAWLPHAGLALPQDEGLVLTGRMHHLGNDPTPDWPEAPEEPEGTELVLEFESAGIAGTATLRIRQRHVSDPWDIVINGVRVGGLERNNGLDTIHYELPAGVIVAGKNELALKPHQPKDDITVGEIRLFDVSIRELLKLQDVRVRVRDGGTNVPLPARITIVRNAKKPRLFFEPRDEIAVRQGTLYTAEGECTFQLPPGDYEIHAVRGMEWSHDMATLAVRDDATPAVVDLELVREVDTTGFIACDTHVHTLTYSGHGDSSVEERMCTLAGEGVELAVATDHNHNTDYRPVQERMGLNRYFTPTVGNEITTKAGHFNAFPLDPKDPVPLHDSADIEAIVKDARKKGAKAVILNHPRWPNHAEGPYGICGLDHGTGESRGEDMPHPYDALEVINSQVNEKEPMLLVHDWFALMNRGLGVKAVGSSDSHTVGGAVGQGRTYLRSSTDDPASIDVDEAARNLVAGRSSISMGIFVDVRRLGRSVMGELLNPADLATSPLQARVASPSWVQPRKLELYVNGSRVQEVALSPEAGRPFDETLELDYTGHGQDAWVCAVVTGDPVDRPYWPQVNAYTLAVSNPVLVDADADGLCSSPRAQAEALLAGTSGTAQVDELLGRVDGPTAVMLVHLAATEEEARSGLLEAAHRRAREHPELERYLRSLEEAESDDSVEK